MFRAEGDPTHLITGIEYFADHPGKANNHQYVSSDHLLMPHSRQAKDAECISLHPSSHRRSKSQLVDAKNEFAG